MATIVKLSTTVNKKCWEFYTFLLTEDPPGEFSIMVAPPLPHPSLVSVVKSGAEMYRSPFNIVFRGEGGGEVSLVNRALEEIIPKLNIQGAFFLTFLSKIVGVVFSEELCLQQANLET